MEPQFRFCTSADGTRIAYATYGSGPPLLYANNFVISIDEHFTIPEAHAYLDALAARTTIVILDPRGAGASERDVDDLSYEARAQDIAAVADATGLRDFTLFSHMMTPACARFAIDHPEQVQRLVLWCPFASMGDKKSALSFRDDWSYARRLWAGVVYPTGPVSLHGCRSSDRVP